MRVYSPVLTGKMSAMICHSCFSISPNRANSLWPTCGEEIKTRSAPIRRTQEACQASLASRASELLRPPLVPGEDEDKKGGKNFWVIKHDPTEKE